MILFARNSDNKLMIVGSCHIINFVVLAKNNAACLRNGTPCCLPYILIDQAGRSIPVVVPCLEPIVQGRSVCHFLILTKSKNSICNTCSPIALPHFCPRIPNIYTLCFFTFAIFKNGFDLPEMAHLFAGL